MKFKLDWFLSGMAIAVGLAWLWPEPGARGGSLHPELITKGGVALIFFLHGAALSFAALKAGTLRWPLHLVVQATTFILFPLIGLLTVWLLRNQVSPELRLGIFYLCALPSTVSSSVALTAAAKGNVPAAVFNATLSSLIGVFLTPLWIGLLLKSGGQPMPLGKVILDLVLWLLLPLALGQLCRPLIGAFVTRHKKRIAVVDRLTILMLVYTSFCDSFQQGIWSGQSWGMLVLTVAGAGLLFFVVMMLVGAASDALGFNREDRITAVFCGSKKTLASGVPMAQLIFGSHPGIGLILLPIMIYHPLQLILCGWLAGKWSRTAPVE
ncbi:MAG: bile acid:sodium symporter [Opitutaceae bacterium]|nr:bile acid:sodium symporter [Opitutaceae bacterium]